MSQIVKLRRSQRVPLGKVTARTEGCHLDIDVGDFVTIAGPSGSGKTTLLNQIGCVDIPTRGQVLIDGQSTTDLSERALTTLRLRNSSADGLILWQCRCCPERGTPVALARRAFAQRAIGTGFELIERWV